MNTLQKHLGHGATRRMLAATAAVATLTGATMTAQAAAPAASHETVTASASKGVTAERMGTGTLKLRYVTVTTSAGPDHRTLRNVASVYVKVCVRQLPPGYAKGLPVSSAVWSYTAFPPKTTLPKRSGKTPALRRTVLHKGQCAQGYVNFDTTRLRGHRYDGVVIRYDSSFGDHGRWSFD